MYESTIFQRFIVIWPEVATPFWNSEYSVATSAKDFSNTGTSCLTRKRMSASWSKALSRASLMSEVFKEIVLYRFSLGTLTRQYQLRCFTSALRKMTRRSEEHTSE